MSRPHGSPMYETYDHDLPLGHGVGKDRHMKARCGACGREKVLDGHAMFDRGWGGKRISQVAARLKCTCGQVGVKLAIYHGPAELFDVGEPKL